MIETSDTKICTICHRPRRLDTGGSITQWISSCHCNLAENSTSSESERTLTICNICRKRIQAGRSGSITQWIFSENFCSCENPQAQTISMTDYKQPSFQFEELEDQEDYLEVDPEDFPLDRYKPIKLLGKGTLGEVYLCRDAYLKKKVAVKCLLTLTEDRVVSFQNEAKIASKLKHGGVIDVLDFGTTNSGRPFMVMQYFAGQSLQDILSDRNSLSEIEFVILFSLICSALAYIHESGVFHRDLKPSNILIGTTNDGSPSACLIDFGLSKATQYTQSQTLVQGRTLVGTPAYMSPDQVNGLDYDVRSEVYSLGCVMYEALSGRPPFIGESALEVLNMHVHEPVPSLTSIDESLSQPLSRIVEKCLSKDPDHRYQSVSEVLAELQTASDEEGKLFVSSEELNQAAPLPPKVRSRKLMIQIGALVLATLIGFCVLAFGRNDIDPELPKRAMKASHRRAVTAQNSTARATSEVLDRIAMTPGVYTYFSGNSSVHLMKLCERHTSANRILLSHCENSIGDIKYLLKLKPRTVEIGFSDKINDAYLKQLSKVSSIEMLYLDGSTGFTAKGLSYLANLPKLTSLSVARCNLDDQMLVGVKEIPTLLNIRIINNRKISLRGVKNCGGKVLPVQVLCNQPCLANLATIQLQELLQKDGVRLVNVGEAQQESNEFLRQMGELPSD